MAGDRVLVSTHDLPRAGRLRDAFRGEGFTVELVTPGEDIEGRDDVALLVLTAELHGGAVSEWLGAARSLDLPVVAFRAPGSTGQEGTEWQPVIAEVFGPGAAPDEVALVARRLVERRRLQESTGIVGETDAMREVLERVVQIAPVASTVLITGESGTGKELVARGLHGLSPRRHRPFIAVNVAAISETLIESELFGHEKGAFTGAIDSRKGLFELAEGGTIFLDEIGEMPLVTQTKLLRVLEQREFLRVGGEKPIRVDVRIVAATNQDLRRLVATGDFRKDLYYRLNVLHIELPPLRERPGDIPLLVNQFIREISRQNDRPFQGITDEAMQILTEHHWPGNVRELRNLIESMVVLSPGGRIRPADIPAEVRQGRRDLLPAPLPARRADGEGGDALRPQLEFVFRTLVELRVDMDELRKEFEAYREQAPTLGRGGGTRGEVGVLPAGVSRADLVAGPDDLEPIDVLDMGRSDTWGERGLASADDDRGVVVFRPGMTMEDLEREAIVAALQQVDGNRRRAADLLGIGERTLYRKIKKFELDD